MTPWSSITVRTAEPTDAVALLSLASSFATSFTVDVERFGSQVDVILSDPASVLSVALTDAEVVGYVAVSLHPTLYGERPGGLDRGAPVHPALRRGGVGRLLVSTVERWAEGRGAVMLSLAPRRAEEFWSAVGYEASATYLRKVL